MKRASHLLRPKTAFGDGLTWIVREHAAGATGAWVDFGIHRLRQGAEIAQRAAKESLWVLLKGRVALLADTGKVEARRDSLFDAGPAALHAGAGEAVRIRALSPEVELAVVQAANPRRLGVRAYLPREVTLEDRGADLAQGACRRTVRTLFDFASRPESQLVVGEVVNRAGRWSSYPPHHHPQPEIYHYRFTAPAGYGHAEVGDDVVKVRSGDTTLIPGGLDHAQVAAPGYGMYYLWVVRHLPRRPYRGFAFAPEHRWLLNPRRQGWEPKS